MQNLHLCILAALHASLLQLLLVSSESNPVYHLGPVLTLPTNIYIIWYGAQWSNAQKSTITDFISSLSSPPSSVRNHPQVSDWWATLADYTDQTNSNITRTLKLAGDFQDSNYSQGKTLTRLAMQHVVRNAVDKSNPLPLPLDYTSGVYLILTSGEVAVADFCRAACGFHYFTFPSVVGVTVPYAWVGYSGTQCPDYCAYPFVTGNMGPKLPPMGPPNGDVGVDGMISVIAHELAEVATDPLVNAWYAGEDPTAPSEVADMCLGIYGNGAGGGYPGDVYNDTKGNAYNLNGVNGRKFLVQWVWSRAKNTCYGPNA